MQGVPFYSKSTLKEALRDSGMLQVMRDGALEIVQSLLKE